VAGQNQEHTVGVAVLTVKATSNMPLPWRVCNDGDFVRKLLARANADTVARHTTHSTYEMDTFIAMTFGLCVPGCSLTAPNTTKLKRM
jgi:hypothetical protein